MKVMAVLAALLTPCALLAGTNEWTSIGPDGGNVIALAIDPQSPLTLYASANDRLFKSTDGGASWSLLNTGFRFPPVALVIDHRNSNTLYAGLGGPGGGEPGGEVFKSTDGGASWSRANSGLNGYFSQASGILATDPQDSNTLYAGVRSGIYKTTNGGASWSAATSSPPPGFNVTALIVDPQDSRTLYAAYSGSPGGGIFKSTDGGAAWRGVNSGLPPSSGVPPENLSVAALVLDPQNSGTAYAWTNGGLFKTTNGAASWSAANSGLPLAMGFVSIAIDLHNPSTLYATWQSYYGALPEQGVFKSIDGGASWTTVDLREPVAVLVIDPQDPGTLYAGTTRGRGIRKSTDGAATWGPANGGLRATGVSALAVDPQDSATIYAATSAGVYRTADGGASWNEPNESGPLSEGSTYFAALAIDPQDTNTLYAAVQTRGIVKSTDGGAHWNYMGLVGRELTEALVVDPQNSGTVYAAGFVASTPASGTGESSPFFIFKTTDGGATWSPKGSFARPVAVLAIDPQSPSTLYAASATGGPVISKSVDGGETWRILELPPEFRDPGNDFPDVSALAVDPQNPETVYVGGGLGLVKSVDAGETWDLLSFGVPDSSAVNALALDPQNSGILYAAVFGHGPLKSTDAGMTWTDVTFGHYESLVNTRVLVIDPENPATVYSASLGGVLAITFVP